MSQEESEKPAEGPSRPDVAQRIHGRVVKELAAIAEPKRRALAGAGHGADENARLEAELDVFDRVEQAPPPARRAQPRELRVAAWNLERGRFPVHAAGVLSHYGADVALLTELDVGMARSDQHHTARQLAATLEHGYVYAVEFVELGLGSPADVDQSVSQQSECGGVAPLRN